MWSSLRTAVSGMLAQQRALDVAADNLTKMQIPGSKSQRVSFIELAPELRYLGVADGEGNVQADARESGRGVTVAANLQNLSQGMFMATGEPLDVAIDGDGFFEVTMPNGQNAYTRGGSLHMDSEGRLMTVTGSALSPEVRVPLDSASVEIQPDGSVLAVSTEGIRQNVGKLKIVRFENPEGLLQIGQNLLLPSTASGLPLEGQAGDPGVGVLVSGIIESSNIDPREEYLRVVQAQRAYELNVRAMKTVDEMLQDANNLRRS
ncbi:MAG: flagellar hook-basal body complex protein [Chloroflexi bacterium]|nr:flagellar hook-basal body complex protein [Chloroflexota bacterium]